MKVAIILVLAFATVLADPDLGDRFTSAQAKCNADPVTALAKNDLDNWRKKGGPGPANLGVHALCLSKALGWQDENGEILKDKLRKDIFENVSNEDSAEVVAQACLIKKENVIETAKHLIDCLFEDKD